VGAVELVAVLKSYSDVVERCLLLEEKRRVLGMFPYELMMH